ncbi:hypothetical protein VIBNISOn1_1600020 [Vibrio nigripulchritudo SOn1]|uniref:Uncharacterized protein n=1 Tax=Vibrio nigripulchritudo SOn1 TaxID=1238450 RepID=A0AAV2VMV8_9VIBR|nr:hypothetical protein VIBNISOn1_1600020 [Vibrio nigripulchritudo SOn1]
MTEMTKRVEGFVVREGLAADAANRMLLPIDWRKAHMCYINFR